MRYLVKIKPRSSKNEIKIIDAGNLVVYTTKSPLHNEANIALIEQLSQKFKISKSKIKIISGLKSRNKIVEIN